MWKCPNPRRYLQYPPKIFLHYGTPAFSLSLILSLGRDEIESRFRGAKRHGAAQEQKAVVRVDENEAAAKGSAVCCGPTKNIKWYAPRFVFYFSSIPPRGRRLTDDAVDFRINGWP